jgi:dephospho-CoA kinase
VVILGLTGSIGMGKSTAARVLKGFGAAVCDADSIVHRLMRDGGAALVPIGASFPGVVREGRIDRRLLGAAVFGNPEALRRLEGILHPLVRAEQGRFLRRAARRRVRVAVLDIPLLFETGGERRVDRTIVVSAPYRIQRARVLARPGMTEATLARILERQMSDTDKRRRADYVVRTGLGKRCARHALARIFGIEKRRRGDHWPPRPRPLER